MPVSYTHLDELRRGYDPRRDQPEPGAEGAEQGLLGDQHPDHLAGGEPERLQHRDVLALYQYAPRGDVGDRTRSGHQDVYKRQMMSSTAALILSGSPA